MIARILQLAFATASSFIAPVIFAQAPGNSNAVARTISASRQFVAYAPNPLWASALCVFAERVKREWLAQLDADDAWRDPIVLVVQSREAGTTNMPAIALSIFQTDIGLKYQIDCVVPPPLDEPALLHTIVEALCNEVINRQQRVGPQAGYVAATAPPWLVDGLAQSLQNRADTWLNVIRRSVAGGQPLPARTLLEATHEPTDEVEARLFHAKAWLFTEGLLGLPRGEEKMQRLLGELGASKSATDAFWTVYAGDFPRPVALEKWWYVRLAERTLTGAAQSLTTSETLRQLDEILQTRLIGNNSAQIEQVVALRTLPQSRKEKWYRSVLDQKVRSLASLRSRTLPRDAQLIDRYITALHALWDDNTKEFLRALAAADASRQTAERDARAINDYLDAAERIYAPQDVAGLFTGYFKKLDEERNIEEQRRSPISDYLDKFDQ